MGVESFEQLREPLVSGRQSPKNLGGILWLSIILQSLIYALEYYVAADSSVYPNKHKILYFHFWVTVSICILCLVYGIPIIYNRSDKMQYVVSILASHNLFTVPFLVITLFLLGKPTDKGILSSDMLNSITLVLLSIGVSIFLMSSIRLLVLLKKGAFKAGAKRESIVALLIKPRYITFGLVMIFLFLFFTRSLVGYSLNEWTIIAIGIMIFFVMLFVLPQQLAILYCKIRFKSFNFNKRGYLYD